MADARASQATAVATRAGVAVTAVSMLHAWRALQEQPASLALQMLTRVSAAKFAIWQPHALDMVAVQAKREHADATRAGLAMTAVRTRTVSVPLDSLGKTANLASGNRTQASAK